MRIIGQHSRENRIALTTSLLFAPTINARLCERPSRSGGSHATDWRCPSCHRFNSIKCRACAKCKAVSPANGRLTRAALHEREVEHRNAATLRRHGL